MRGLLSGFDKRHFENDKQNAVFLTPHRLSKLGLGKSDAVTLRGRVAA